MLKSYCYTKVCFPRSKYTSQDPCWVNGRIVCTVTILNLLYLVFLFSSLRYITAYLPLSLFGMTQYLEENPRCFRDLGSGSMASFSKSYYLFFKICCRRSWNEAWSIWKKVKLDSISHLDDSKDSGLCSYSLWEWKMWMKPGEKEKEAHWGLKEIFEMTMVYFSCGRLLLLRRLLAPWFKRLQRWRASNHR